MDQEQLRIVKPAVSPKRNCRENPERKMESSVVCLEKLPLQILEMIFDLLETKYLLDIRTISRDLYWPATRVLYRFIIMVDEVDFDDIRVQESIWPYYHCTIMNVRQTVILVDVLKENKKLAAMVESIVVGNTDEVSLVPELLSYTSLKYFHYEGILQIPRKSLDNVRTLACCVPSASIEKPNVTELKLYQPLIGTVPDFYAHASSSMTSLGSYRKLRKLSIAVTHWSNDSYFELEEMNTHSWEYFISNFMRYHELQLDSLRIEGQFLDFYDSRRSFDLYQGVNLGILKTLELKFVGYCPSGEQYVDHHSTEFSYDLSKYLHLLKNLSLIFEYTVQTNVESDIKTLAKVLDGKLRNQLSLFSISFEPHARASLCYLHNAILRSQKQLVNLKINNGDIFSRIGRTRFDKDPNLKRKKTMA
ncbi:hypothetical protein METBIDRAFT_84919 [Metschnikowia bicuspidata var. bicuspidata NRRL YB-4993]|uniref:F-box domain-containing protein n=1 Tax=Metschnikowia bicuspidata var. bicuspidata NRRL YB-4993 TaxID=869754 RepID=A0A1A0H1S2_9ASCO|nr:hypothetical protein METBIDRAFT_84919 [Metschnikowia bicuspidata var. bicuspidata NRRL YB-4993]OBA17979.1 hypothetical protein METBIDRAFT_84919 [Metschnikowia bicuspidata var. bicuspidata NRRL YB-4993]